MKKEQLNKHSLVQRTIITLDDMFFPVSWLIHLQVVLVMCVDIGNHTLVLWMGFLVFMYNVYKLYSGCALCKFHFHHHHSA